ncbi:DUF6777 domain-containing protein [Streptomyces krungchingensis]|uniref:DUF6777 domain-containing protein n=1 Tax=Streptomyces krungchingensis TaxID=1565034 RepID=UPI003CEFA694
MHIPTRALVTACTLAAALLVAGCGGDSGQASASGASSGEDVYLQPVTDRGPDPFTDSTATGGGADPGVTRTPQPAASGGAFAPRGTLVVPGSLSGLYGGTRNTASCDVEKEIRFLAADGSKARAFAGVAGISRSSVPDFLRGLTSVVLRADTRVTNHGFSDGRATSFQSVLQTGTAVLVDDRGVPRVRCACGNPIGTPAARGSGSGTRGTPWSGYRPTQVVEVAPAPTVITGLTIVDVDDHQWIERPTGHDGHRHDHVVPAPDGSGATERPYRSSPGPYDSAPGVGPDGRGTGPDCGTPTAAAPVPSRPTGSVPGGTPGTVTPGARPPGADSGSDQAAAGAARSGPTRSGLPTGAPSAGDPVACATATPSATESGTAQSPPDRSAAPGRSASAVPPAPPSDPGTPDEDTGPETVPEDPDVPDGGGLVPEETADTDTIFDAATDVFGG